MSCDVCNFADDTTLNVCNKNLEYILTKLEEHSDIAIKWFENNYMKMNSDKCHLFISSHKFEHLWDKIGNDKIWETRTVKLLGITIDNDLKFDEHLNNVCLKANRKLSALTTIRKYLDFNKTRILFKGLFERRWFVFPSIIAIFRHCALNYSKYITTKHKQLLVIYLYVTIALTTHV